MLYRAQELKKYLIRVLMTEFDMLWIIRRINIIVTDAESLQSFRSDNLVCGRLGALLKMFFLNYIVIWIKTVSP